MKHVFLECDSCHRILRNVSAEITVFDRKVRRDFCTSACFGEYVQRHYGGEGGRPTWLTQARLNRTG